ncbi:MAG: helix-turn-helix domain-containing protein, partial [Lachnospiraceae bacterium]|nr:helix-turn-helix domain-containing protein [Lachnospiraceae bacterium]
YDKRNATSLLKTAQVYLECWKNTQKTAELLHVHKNTLYYRLQRIEALCGIKFENSNTCFGMLMTFKLMKYNQ